MSHDKALYKSTDTLLYFTTSLGCNARSSPAVYVIIHVFNSSVHSHITLKIITFCWT